MRDAVQQLGQVTGEVGVPGVGVDHVAVARRTSDRQVDREGLQGGVCVGQFGGGAVAGGAVARVAPGVNGQVDEASQLAGQEVDVDSAPP